MSSIEGMPGLEFEGLGLNEELQELIDRVGATHHDLLGILPSAVQWSNLWATHGNSGRFIVPHLLPVGRQAAIFSKAKQGKSLLALDIAVSVAVGGAILGENNETGPVSVLYLDMEMTDDDLRERLTAFGIGPTSDLANLHYYLLPNLPPLNTAEGSRVLEAMIDLHRPSLIVIDTLGRVVSGEENSAETIRSFYQFSGVMLKRRGISMIRLDHEGKDSSNGARGSSAKNDDVDIVWRLTRSAGLVTLKCQFARINWIPTLVKLEVQANGQLPGHRIATHTSKSSAEDIADQLEVLGVELDASIAVAQAALATSGGSRRREDVAKGMRLRKSRL